MRPVSRQAQKYFHKADSPVLRRTLIAFLVVSAIFASNLARGSSQHLRSQFGAIRGRVLDPGGKPVAGASVYAKTTAPSARGMFATKSDESGVFFFREVPAGGYRVYATKDDTDISNVFFNSPPWTVNALVREARVTRGVTVRLYTNTATLLGRAQDEKTGELIANARMFLYRDDNPARWISIGARLPAHRFRLLIPDISFRIKVSAPGYEDWYYGRDGSKEHAEVLRLEPNTVKELTIPLRRSR